MSDCISFIRRWANAKLWTCPRVGPVVVAVLLLLAAGGGVRAEETGIVEPGAAQSERVIAVMGITVTANKIDEDITDVPQSITVIDEIMLEERGIKTVADIIREIPNMKVSSGPVAGAVSVRGLNPSIFTNNNPVVIYIDGVPHSNIQGFDASLVNAERVEVLRGPQGTLYGKDAIGGVINIVTKTPTNTWQGKVGTEYGSYNYMRGVFNTSGALINDKLFLGLNGQYWQDDGWIENTAEGMDKNFNKEDDRRLNLNLALTPTDRFTARLSLNNEYSRQHGINGIGLPSGAVIGDFSRDDAETLEMDAPTKQITENNAQSLGLAYDFGPVSLNAVTTHKNLKFSGQYDADFGNDPLYAGLIQFNDFDAKSWTQELRLSSNNERGLRWVSGLYFETEKHDQDRMGMQFPDFDPVSYAYLGNSEMSAVSHTDSDTWAAFGQVTIPFAEQFELTLGGRYQRIKKKIDLSMYYLPVGISGPAMYQLEAEKTWETFLPKAALSWQFADAWNTYVSWSRGYMPGGFNYFAMDGSAEDNRFEPQISTNYEWGVKGNFERGSVAASIFYMDIEDIHISKAIGTMYVTGNAKKAHSQGVELEATYRPLDELELNAAMGFIQAKYDDYDWGGGNFDGQTIEQTPAHTIRAGAGYTHPSGFYGRIDVSNIGKQYFHDNVNAIEVFPKQDMYTLVDAKIGYRFADWDFYVYGRNLTDEKYVSMFSGMHVISYGQPRTFGVGVRYQF
ncbi:TonB-dependent receptor [Desulfonatronum thiodismutans]|uniref:TonB-dependent receptor n=1 Tax=Desulfonatronum thiodismutans TaxID=159290 RepID=UPI0009FFEC5A|nr:TonB-dependent receptor [Desulfonatronum thiodismutans]